MEYSLGEYNMAWGRDIGPHIVKSIKMTQILLIFRPWTVSQWNMNLYSGVKTNHTLLVV